MENHDHTVRRCTLIDELDKFQAKKMSKTNEFGSKN